MKNSLSRNGAGVLEIRSKHPQHIMNWLVRMVKYLISTKCCVRVSIEKINSNACHENEGIPFAYKIELALNISLKNRVIVAQTNQTKIKMYISHIKIRQRRQCRWWWAQRNQSKVNTPITQSLTSRMPKYISDWNNYTKCKEWPDSYRETLIHT